MAFLNVYANEIRVVVVFFYNKLFSKKTREKAPKDHNNAEDRYHAEGVNKNRMPPLSLSRSCNDICLILPNIVNLVENIKLS